MAPPPVSQEAPALYVRGETSKDGSLQTDSASPALAVDLDHLHEKLGRDWDKTRSYLQKIMTQGYRVIGLTSDPSEIALLKDLPILLADKRKFNRSPFQSDGAGFDQIQLETLKSLKFQNGIPIVGIITRDLTYADGYEAAGITPLNSRIDISSFRPKLQEAFASYQRGIRTAPTELFWRGTTGTGMTRGNDIEFVTNNREAQARLKAIIQGATRFICLGNISLLDDEEGREIMELLKEKARKGVEVHVLLDNIITRYSLPTERGMVGLTKQRIQEMEQAGVKVLFHGTVQYLEPNEPFMGALVRRHRKMVIADNAQGEVVSFGGSRLLGSISLSLVSTRPTSFLENNFGIGDGPYQDVSFVVKGEASHEMYKKFQEDWGQYGGDQKTFPPVPPPRSYPQNTPLRYVTQDSYHDQNTLNVVLNLLKDPFTKTVTIANSFPPSRYIIEAMKEAVRNGKKVRYVAGRLFPIFDRERNAMFQELLEGGVEIYLLRGKFHAKVYTNDRWATVGNFNLDDASLRDAEDLMVTEASSQGAAPLIRYVENLVQQATPLHEHFKKGFRGKALEQWAEEVTKADLPVTLPADEKVRKVGFAFSDLLSPPRDLMDIVAAASYAAATGQKPLQWKLQASYQEGPSPWLGLTTSLGPDVPGFTQSPSHSLMELGVILNFRLGAGLFTNFEEILLSFSQDFHATRPYALTSWLQLHTGIQLGETLAIPVTQDHRTTFSFTALPSATFETPWLGWQLAAPLSYTTDPLLFNPLLPLGRALAGDGAHGQVSSDFFTTFNFWKQSIRGALFVDASSEQAQVGAQFDLTFRRSYPRQEWATLSCLFAWDPQTNERKGSVGLKIPF